MTDKLARVVRVLNADEGKFTEEVTTPRRDKGLLEDVPLNAYPRDHRGRITISEDNLLETAGGTMTTANFPDLLRQGLRYDAFSSYNEQAVTWPLFCRTISSNKQQEEYLIDAGMGVPPVVSEGEDYPKAAVNLAEGKTIKNFKRGYRLEVTEEMRMFDQVGKVRDLAMSQGRAFRMGEEADVYGVLTTTANYTRNSTTGDNDVGANYGTTTFSPTGLITAFRTLVTMKDRKSGDYLGVQPNTLIITPGLWMAAQQLIRSPQVMRAHADADGDIAEVYGTGTRNSFFNIVNTIIVSPWLGTTYQWALLESNMSIMFQRVLPFEILGPDFEKTNDTYSYRCRTFYGVGMKDDRFAYFSNSTTAPATT